MSQGKIINYISNVFSKHQEAIATMIVALPGVGLDAIAEYDTAGFSSYLMRDFFYLGVMIVCFLLFKFNLIKKKEVFRIPVYIIIVGQMISVLFRIQNPEYSFEPYFLKAEIIFALMMFGIGSLVHANHITALLIVNTIFIITCYFMVPEFPTTKLIFYAVMVSSSTLLVFFSQRMLVQLYTNLKEASNIIQLKNEELSKMNLAKDQIFKIIGHDLRTPFHQVNSLVDLIDETEDKEERTEIKSLLKESSAKGHKLLEDLLKWSTTFHKDSEIELEKKNISEVVSRVFEFSDLKSKDKDITLINQLPNEIELLINLTMMETVFRNLISNAIKFSYRGSEVIIKSERTKELLKISIIDKGMGISKFRLNNLLINSKNDSTFGTESEEGNGFGLNIAKELVEKQHGVFEILSKENKGTTVNLYFPII